MEHIDQKISAMKNELIEFAKTLNFEYLCEFSIADFDSIPWKILNCQGLYLIEIKNDRRHQSFKDWADDFCMRWMDGYFAKSGVSTPKKMRILKHSDLRDWIPLYIGKSKKIRDRVYEHINLKLEQPTTGLKLKVKKNMENEIFRLSFINIPTENYDLVMPIFEKNMRDRINPIIGRQ